MERSIGRRTGTLTEDTGGIKTLLVGRTETTNRVRQDTTNKHKDCF